MVCDYVIALDAAGSRVSISEARQIGCFVLHRKKAVQLEMRAAPRKSKCAGIRVPTARKLRLCRYSQTPEIMVKYTKLLDAARERGIRAAKAAGMRVAAITATMPREVLAAEDPDILIDSFMEFDIEAKTL